ncbi:MAG: oligosaccharide flippase family protein [Phycisphaeraceae bacterium]|nr:MAG: oligosaccharide flippase family protein [Phycisphaeraceae bacterium]
MTSGLDTAAAPPSGSPQVGKPGGGNLGDKAAVGFVFMVAQTLGVRFVRLGGQVLLAWLLFPEDFKLFALAVTVHQFVSVLKNAGLRDILIHRQAGMQKWINPAVWMSAAMGVGGGLLIVVISPAVVWFYGGDRALYPLLFVLALTTLFQSLGQVPTAILHAELRFKLGATIEAVNNTLQMVLTVYYAWAELGPLSFVLPMLLIAFLRTAYMWWLIRPRVRRDPQLRRWRYILGDSTRLIGADVARTISYQADYMTLGRTFPNSPVLGHYYYAFQISSQAVMLLGRNFDIVLFPALSSIKDHAERHRRAFIQAMRMLAIVGFPLCLLQGAAAAPTILALLPQRFHPTIPYVVVLSVGMAPRLMIPICSAMLRSQGRFAVYSKLTWGFAFAVVAFAVTAAIFSTAIGVAVAVSAAFVVSGLLHVIVTLWGGEAPIRSTLRVFAAPTILSIGACMAGWFAASALPSHSVMWNLARASVVVAVVAAVYTPLIYLFEREATLEIVRRLTRLLKRRAGRRAALEA